MSGQILGELSLLACESGDGGSITKRWWLLQGISSLQKRHSKTEFSHFIYTCYTAPTDNSLLGSLRALIGSSLAMLQEEGQIDIVTSETENEL